MDILLPKNFENADALQVLDQARPILELPADAELRVENVTKNARGTRINFSYTQSVAVDDALPRDVTGIRVDVSAHGDLKFNARGNLVSYKVEPADPRELRAITDHLSKLVENGQVYVAEPGECVDPEQLRQQGKPWYVQEDEQGKKHLKRAWVS